MSRTIGQSSKPVAVAVIGAGYFSQFHLAAWCKVEGAQLVAICDQDEQRARNAAKRYGIQRAYTDVAEMLDSCSVDLADVIVQPQSQEAILSQLLGRRIPTICQKPFGTSYAQAAAFVQLAKAQDCLLIVHENFRFMPWMREIRRLMDQGFFGAPLGIDFRLRPGDGQGADAYLARQPYFRTMSRLLVRETAIHFIDSFRYLMGEIDSVYAQLRRLNPVICGEDAAVIVFGFHNGTVGVFDGNRLNDHVARDTRKTMGEMWVEGMRGVLRMDGDANLWWKPHQGPEARHDYPAGDDSAYGGGTCLALQQHVIRALRTGAGLENDAESYLRNRLVEEAIYASDHSGARIYLDAFNAPV